MKKKQKAPGFFKKKVSEKKFRKRYLKPLLDKKLRTQLIGTYRNAEGIWHLRDDLKPDEIAALKKSKKIIKQNKGAVRRGKLIVLIVIVIAILFFNFFLKNRLIETAMERGLEEIFQAQVEVDKVNLKLLESSFSLEHLAVADRDQPFRNLFETGRMVVDFSMQALLRKRIIIERISLEEITWNTPRSTSGALTKQVKGDSSSAGEGAESEEGDKKGLLSDISFGVPDIDVGVLIDEQMSNLKSNGALESINKEIGDLKDTWSTSISKMETQLQVTGGSVRTLTGTNLQSIDSVDSLKNLIADITTLTGDLQTLKGDVGKVTSDFTKEFQEVKSLTGGISGILEDDYQYLADLLRLPAEGGKDLMAGFLGEYLRESIGELYDYGMKALQVLEYLKGKKGEAEEGGARRDRGIDVAFPTKALPRFLLRNLELSVVTGSTYHGSLQNVSSDPDLLDKPAEFTFQVDREADILVVTGFLDGRTDAETPLRVEVGIDNPGISLTEFPAALHFETLTGSSDFNTAFSIEKGGGYSGTADLELSEVTVVKGAQDLLTRVVADTLTTLDPVTAGFKFTKEPKGPLKISVETNLDEAIASQIGNWIADQTAAYKEKLRDEFENRFAGEIEKIEGNLSSLEGYGETLSNMEGQLAAYETQVGDKLTDIENRIAELAKTGIIDKAVESIQLPKIPKVGF
jgi:uncharacterized protein (TIGR03545 family)